VPEHSHDSIQISIPLGDTVARVAWKTAGGTLKHAVIRKGHALIIPAHQRHAISWKNRVYFVNFHLSGQTIADERHSFLRIVDRIGDAHVVLDPFLTRLGEIVVMLAAKAAGLDEIMLQGLRHVLEAHIVSPYGESALRVVSGSPEKKTLSKSVSRSTDARKTNGLADSHLKTVMRSVRQNLSRDWTVDELSQLIGMSAGHFSRAFRSATGASPRQWIIQQRIEYALDKLLTTDDPLVDIAHACGFNEQTHFTRTFARIIGISPGAWRRRYR
jgi:AraC-like DNA-binding protein